MSSNHLVFCKLYKCEQTLEMKEENCEIETFKGIEWSSYLKYNEGKWGWGCQAVKFQKAPSIYHKSDPVWLFFLYIFCHLCDEQIKIYTSIQRKSLLCEFMRGVSMFHWWISCSLKNFEWISWSNKKLSEWLIHESELYDCTNTSYEDCLWISNYMLVCSSFLV